MTIIRRLTAAFAVVLAVVAVVLAAPAAAQTVPPGDVVDYGAARLAPGPIGDSVLRALGQDEEPPSSGLGGSRNYGAAAIVGGTGFWLAWESGLLSGFSCDDGRYDEIYDEIYGAREGELTNEPYGPFLGITCSEEDGTKSTVVSLIGVTLLSTGLILAIQRTPVNVTPTLNGIRLSW